MLNRNSTRARSALKALLAVACAGTLAVGLGACGSSTGQETSGAPRPSDNHSGSTAAPSGEPSGKLQDWTPPAKGTLDDLKWNITDGEPVSLDPIKITSFAQSEVISNLCDTLFLQPPDNKLVPGLATKYEQVDPETVAITLREDAKFWNGNRVTAEDVVFSIERAMNDPASIDQNPKNDIKSVRATGDHSVELVLTRPNYVLKYLLANVDMSIIEKEYAEKAGQAYGTPEGGVMCSGAFEFEEWNAGQSIVMTRNANYWDQDLVPKSAKVTFSFITDAQALVLALKSGDVDGVYNPPYSILPTLEQIPGGNIYYGPSPVVMTMMITTATGKWADVRVRQALADSIPYEAIVSSNYGAAAEPARSLLTPPQFPTDDDEALAALREGYDALPPPTQNMERAKALLAEADAVGTSLKMAIPSDVPYWKNALQAVATSATEAGFDVTIEQMPVQTYNDSVFDENATKAWDLVSYPFNGANGDPTSMLKQLYVNPSMDALARLNEPYVNAVKEAIATPDSLERAKAGVQLQIDSMKYYQWLPIAYEYGVVYYNEGITGGPAAWPLWVAYPDLAFIGSADK